MPSHSQVKSLFLHYCYIHTYIYELHISVYVYTNIYKPAESVFVDACIWFQGWPLWIEQPVWGETNSPNNNCLPVVFFLAVESHESPLFHGTISIDIAAVMVLFYAASSRRESFNTGFLALWFLLPTPLSVVPPELWCRCIIWGWTPHNMHWFVHCVQLWFSPMVSIC